MEKTKFIICPICSKELALLTTKHLKSHNLNVKMLKEKYPDVIIYSDVYLENKKILDKKYVENNKDKINSYLSKYRLENKDKRNDYQKQYSLDNSDIIKEKKKIYYQLNKGNKEIYDKKYRNENIDKIRDRQKIYRENNKDKRVISDKEYNLKNKHLRAWRGILANSLRDLKKKKNGKTIDLLGYSALELKEHIESLFTENMSWYNHGEWHIDHIKQVVSFNQNTPASIVNALSNLRPLWATTREINGVICIGNLNRPKYNK